jgi:hypothetical protein
VASRWHRHRIVYNQGFIMANRYIQLACRLGPAQEELLRRLVMVCFIAGTSAILPAIEIVENRQLQLNDTANAKILRTGDLRAMQVSSHFLSCGSEKWRWHICADLQTTYKGDLENGMIKGIEIYRPESPVDSKDDVKALAWVAYHYASKLGATDADLGTFQNIVELSAMSGKSATVYEGKQLIVTVSIPAFWNTMEIEIRPSQGKLMKKPL